MSSILSRLRGKRRSTVLASVRKSLAEEGDLGDRFFKLEEFEEVGTPNLTEETAEECNEESLDVIPKIDEALKKIPLDFVELNNFIVDLKNTCMSIGAEKVSSLCTKFSDYCKQENGEGCKKTFKQLKKEHRDLKKKLKAYFKLAGAVGMASSPSSSAVN